MTTGGTGLFPGREPIFTGLLTGEAPPPSTAALLAASLARETELLAAAADADHAGWRRALTETRARLTARTVEGRDGEGFGLREALRIVDDLTARPRIPTPHRLTARILRGRVEYRVTCDAPPGAACRLECEGSVRGVCIDQHADGCDRTLVDSGECGAVPWFDNNDDAYLLDAYAGPARPFEPGPVLLRWSTADGDWEWLYPEDAAPGGGWTGATP